MYKLATRSFFPIMAALALLTLVAFQINGQVSQADDEADLGKEIAGTFLGVQTETAQIMQISEDGNLSMILSIQFTGGAADLVFSNALGSWIKTGEREITAKAIDLDFEKGDGSFAGVGVSTYVISFDEKFQTASVASEGAVYPLGVSPLQDPDADPIPDGEWAYSNELQRFPIAGN
jgi:hypothetical protein